jgi:hypothetical protein
MTTENFYLGIIVVLFVLQIYQLSVMSKLKGDINQLWDQMAILTAMTAAKLTDMVLKKKEQVDESKSKV